MHANFIGGLVFIDDYRIASSSEDGFIKILDYRTPEEIISFAGHGGEPVNHIVYDSDRNILISCGDDFRIKLWDGDTYDEIAALEGHENYVSHIAIAGNRLLSASKDQTVGVWDLDKYTLLHRFSGHNDWVYNLAASPDNREAVSCSVDNRVLHWDIETGEQLNILNEGAKRLSIYVNNEELYIQLKGACKEKYRPIGHTVLWPRQELLITAGHQIAFWDTETWEIKKLSRIMYFDVKQLQYTGSCLIAISRSIIGMDLESGEELFELTGIDREEIKAASISMDRRLLATGDDSGMVDIRSLDDLQKKEYVFGHSGNLESVLPCGEGIVMTGGRDLSAALWDVNTGKLIYRFSDFQTTAIGSVYLNWTDRSAGDVALTTDHEMIVVNIRSRTNIQQFDFTHSLYSNHSLVRYADGFLAAEHSKGIIYTDVKTGTQYIVENQHCYYGDSCLSPDGKLFLATCTTGVPDSVLNDDMSEEEKDRIKQRERLHAPLVLFDPEKRKVIREFWYPGFFKKIKCDKDKAEKKDRHHPVTCSWSPDGKYFSAVYSCGELMVWKTDKLKRLLRKKVPKDAGNLPLTWIDNVTVILFVGKGSIMRKISVIDGKENDIAVSDSNVQISAFSADRRYLAIDCPGERFEVYDLQAGETISNSVLPSKVSTFKWDEERLYIGTVNGMLYSFTIADASLLICPEEDFPVDESLIQ